MKLNFKMKLLIVLILSFSFHFSQAVVTDSLDGLKDLSGKAWSNQYQDKKVLLFFWATWCTDCKEKLKEGLGEIQKQYMGLSVLAVNMDSDLDRTKHYIKKEGISLPIFRDEDKLIRQKLKVFSAPHWAVFHLKGNIWALVDTAPAFELERVHKALKRSL